ncbi:GNAT family N-acetyltransferase [Maritimibacter sp. UBA3975]|uniref:GNAT family N-acetyltransferase n=1 Tax=Maritimibacter sp. UBA3975 TaxID=1946833 RepID=UPI000C09C211|nr:GNAT family N-acetyltransferase [Maritimibacter sp. UBA3975]MAM62125.1 GNAT family N-acetyltransferase [Maritimibacter sp.]|tara:strand:+ start:6896 stop:7735 length:840 start_codon:yes stop_codon:yes gene_type:complete
MRPANPSDIAGIDAFLAQHAEKTMFLRANLARFGLDEREHTHGTRYVVEGPPGAVTGVFGLSNGGFVMGQGQDWPGFARSISGTEVIGINGAADQVAAARAALNLPGRTVLDRDEPHYRLDLDALVTDAFTGGRLRPPTLADVPLLTRWNAAYTIDTLGAEDGPENEAEALARTERMIAEDHGRVLEIDGTPVAMTAFNARLPDMVQIGGVYTPPEHRGRGHARTAVGLHLIEARARGVKTSILFASGVPACRAYEALGFHRIGLYTLVIFAEAMAVAA